MTDYELFNRKIAEEYHRHCADLHKVLEAAAIEMAESIMGWPDTGQDYFLKKITGHIVMVLINTSKNRELLKDVPHREFHDLSIVYHWLAEDDQNSGIYILISKKLSDIFGMSEKILYNAAIKNTERIFPPRIRLLDEMLKIAMLAGEPSCGTLDDKNAYLITNSRGINGAVSMLYENELFKLAERMGSDLYLMPCSVHSVIAVSDNYSSPDELARMISGANINGMPSDERLSMQVYHYGKDTRRLAPAVGRPTKTY